jgi:transcriptional regulator with XRE-family HTH domain
MGKPPREKPTRLPRKLLAIRNQLGVSQTEMAKLLKLKKTYTVISSYERGTGEPNLLILLRYARLAHVSTDVLIDDKLDLPRK